MAADPRATHLADQFTAEVIDRARGRFEEALHEQGYCTEDFDESLVLLLDSAMIIGAHMSVAVLSERGRIRGVDEL